MDKKAIETLAVNAVKGSIVRSDFLDQFIQDNNKEPSWDGFVYIYKEKTKRKDRIEGRMPVQVKGKIDNNFDNHEIMHPVSIADLYNYLYDGGVIFFLVYITSDGFNNKIFYAELPPIKLRVILGEAQGQKTKSIQLKEFPDDGNTKASIFLNCLHHCRKQSSFIDVKLHTLEELEAQGVLDSVGTSVSGYDLNNQSFMRALVNNEIYMYANTKGGAIPQPLEFIPESIHTVEESKDIISVNGVPYYYSCTRIFSKESVVINIGHSFRVECFSNGSKTKTYYKNSDMARILAKDLEFQLAVIDANQFEINGLAIPLDCSNGCFSGFDIEEQQKWLICVQKVVCMLDMLGAKGDISISKLTKEEIRHLSHLVTAFVEKEPIHGLKPDLPPALTYSIGDFTFALVHSPVGDDKGTYYVYDFFKTKLEITSEDADGNHTVTSQYMLLSSEDFLRITNIRFDVLLPSFQEYGCEKHIYDKANNTLLHMLNAYDVAIGERKSELLNTASAFSEWIMDAPDDDLPHVVCYRNRMQVIRRQRDFTLDEIEGLCAIAENASYGEERIIGAHLLLGNQLAAEVHWRRLDAEKQAAFKKYPIYTFWIHRDDNDNEA